MSFFQRRLVELDQTSTKQWLAAINVATQNLFEFEAGKARLWSAELSCFPGYFYMYMVDSSAVPPSSGHFIVCKNAHVLNRETLKELQKSTAMVLDEQTVAEYVALYLAAKNAETFENMEIVPDFLDLQLTDTPPQDVATAMADAWPEMTVLQPENDEVIKLRVPTVIEDTVALVAYTVRPNGQVVHETVRPMYDELPLMQPIPF